MGIIPLYMQTNNTQALLASIVLFCASYHTCFTLKIHSSSHFLIRGEKRLLALSYLSVYTRASLTEWIFVQFDTGLV